MRSSPLLYARVLIEVNDRVVELVLAEGALIQSHLCRVHEFPPPSRPGQDILVRRGRSGRKTQAH